MRRLKAYNFLIISIFIASFVANSAIASRVNTPLQDGLISVEDLKPIGIGPSNVSGRARALLFDKRDHTGNTVYMGTVGGLYKSTDAGNAWQAVSSVNSNLAVTSLAQDKAGYIYVGTGEDFTIGGHGTNNYYAGIMGGGIFRTTDATSHEFAILSNTVPAIGNINDFWAFINRLAGNSQSDMVYVATDKGFKYSEDHGETWKDLKAENSTSLTNKGWDIKASPKDATVALVCGIQVYTSPTGSDGTFIKAASGLPTTSAKIGRIELAISPSNPNYIYAVVANPNGLLDSIYRSTDRGENWKTIIKNSSTFDLFTSAYPGLGLYNNSIAVYPNDSSKIMMGGLDLWVGNNVEGDTYQTEQISVVSDGGPTENVSSYNFLYVHRGIHAIAFNPYNSKFLLIADDGGISRSTDGGRYFNPITRYIKTSQVFGLDAGATGSVVAGLSGNSIIYLSRQQDLATPQDAQTYLSTVLNPQTSTGVGAVISKFKMVSPFDREYLFPSSSNGYVARTYDKSTWNYPTQTTTSAFFSDAMNGEATSLKDSFCAFVTPMLLWETTENTTIPDSVTWAAPQSYQAGDYVMVQSNQNNYPFEYELKTSVDTNTQVVIQSKIISRMFIGTGASIYMSPNPMASNTPTWIKLIDFLGDSKFRMVTKLAISGDGDHLFFATKANRLYRLSNLLKGNTNATLSTYEAGKVTTLDTLWDFGSRVINSIAIDPKNPNNVVVTLGGYGFSDYVYKSNDALQTSPSFVNIQGTLPAMPVYASLIEMNNNKIVLLGTEKGLYGADDANFASTTAPTWKSISTAYEKNKYGEITSEYPINSVPIFQIKQQTEYVAPQSFWKKTPYQIDTSLFTHQETSNYGVIYIASFGKGIFEIDTFKITSIKDVPSSKGLTKRGVVNIYPNPVTNVATVEFMLEQRTNVTINIIDITGRVVKQINAGNRNPGLNTINFEKADLSKGVYTVEIKTPQQSSSAKFIIQ